MDAEYCCRYKSNVNVNTLFCFPQSAQNAGTAAASSGQLSALQASAGAAGKAPGPQISASAAAEEGTSSQASAGVDQESKAPNLCRLSEGKSVTCSLCSQEVMSEDYTQHLSDYHVQEQCEQCGAKAWGLLDCHST